MRDHCLCLIADRPSLGAGALEVLAAALAGCPGRAVVIDRGDAPARERLAYLAALRALTRRAGALLMVSRRVDLALAAGADGVHLPELGLPAADVKAAWPALRVGRSCHDRAGLLAAARDGVDYALLSPIAAPLSKPASAPPLGVPGFSAAIAGLSLPVYALGGVRPALAGALRDAGAAGVASLGGVLLARDARDAARELLGAWDARLS